MDRVVTKLKGEGTLGNRSSAGTSSATKKTPQELLRDYYEKQKAAKRSCSSFGSKKQKKDSSTEDIYVGIRDIIPLIMMTSL